MTPTFFPSTKSYAVSVSAGTDSVTLNIVPNDPRSSVTASINGADPVSFSTSLSIPTGVGKTTVEIVSTSFYFFFTPKYYTFTFTRRKYQIYD